MAPSYFISERGIKALKSIAGEFIHFSGQNPVKASFTGQGGLVEIYFLTADHPETILGEGYDGVIVDEAARMERAVWEQYIRPALADKHGWAIIISTPKGRGWFYDLFQRGQDKTETQYRSYTFTSRDNPFFTQDEWDEAKRTTPADIFEQEYEGKFMRASGGVFRDVAACLFDEMPARLGELAVGVDLAKHSDFTVNISMDRTSGACFDMDRFNNLEWTIQKERIAAFSRKWPGLVVLDATGAGDPIYDDLRLVVPNIEPVKFTNAVKVSLIRRLMVAIEQHQISWPRSWTVLTDELERYEYKISETGTTTYSAPEGRHDDCVIALALANSARFAHMRSGEIKVFAPRNAQAEGGIVQARTLGSRPRGAPGKGRGRILF